MRPLHPSTVAASRQSAANFWQLKNAAFCLSQQVRAVVSGGARLLTSRLARTLAPPKSGRGLPAVLTPALLMLFLAGGATASAQGALLASITNLANGDMLIQFSGGVPGALYDVEESSNLLTWTVAATDPANAMGSFSFEDTATAGVPMQFYSRAASAYTVGGALTGLATGDTVTLQDNGSDNLTLSTNGTFTFATTLPNGYAYSVTVSGTSGGTPINCTLTNGSGTISGANVTNVAVQCTLDCPGFTGDLDLDMYNAAVSDGTANGGVPGVMLTQYGGPFRVTALGPCSDNVCFYYYFGVRIHPSRGNRLVHFDDFPQRHSCHPVRACGALWVWPYRILDSENKIMNDLNPSRKPAARPHAGCFLAQFRLFGMPAALIPALLMLVLAGGVTASAALLASITNLANGDMLIQFSGGVPGALFDVEESSDLLTWTVAATDPANALGSFSFEQTATAGVSTRFYRAASAFTVGGTLTGLPAGDTVTLQDNGSDNLTLSANGTFTFPTALPNGHAYSVTVSGIFFGGAHADDLHPYERQRNHLRRQCDERCRPVRIYGRLPPVDG